MTSQYQLLPFLHPDEYEALRADIKQRGVQVAVEYDEHDNILDGHHRVMICRELGISEWPRIVRPGLTEQQKQEHVLALNLNRRHLTREQRQELVAKLRGNGWSTTKIAEAVHVTHPTVLSDLKTACKDLQPATVTGKDGKQYPAQRSESAPQPTLAPQPEWTPPATKPAQQATAAPVLMGNITFDHTTAATMPAPQPSMAVLFSSETPEHYTPRHILDAAIECLGSIDLDPCAETHDSPNVPAAQHFTREDDGLARSWQGRVYLNPPYGTEIGKWVEKLCSEHERGNVVYAIALLPARPDTAWFRRLRDYPVCFVAGRLTFIGNEAPAPFPSAIFYLGEDTGGFCRVFGSIGDIYQRAYLDVDGQCWSGAVAE